MIIFVFLNVGNIEGTYKPHAHASLLYNETVYSLAPNTRTLINFGLNRAAQMPHYERFFLCKICLKRVDFQGSYGHFSEL